MFYMHLLCWIFHRPRCRGCIRFLKWTTSLCDHSVTSNYKFTSQKPNVIFHTANFNRARKKEIEITLREYLYFYFLMRTQMSKSFMPQGFPHVKVLTHPYVMRAIFIFITKMRDGSKGDPCATRLIPITWYIYLSRSETEYNELLASTLSLVFTLSYWYIRLHTSST